MAFDLDLVCRIWGWMRGEAFSLFAIKQVFYIVILDRQFYTGKNSLNEFNNVSFVDFNVGIKNYCNA
jgi:hypothetical protein